MRARARQPLAAVAAILLGGWLSSSAWAEPPAVTNGASAAGWSPSIQTGGNQPSGKGRSRAAPARKNPAGVEATAAGVINAAGETIFTLSLSASAAAQAYTLDAPRRVVVDLPNVAFRLPPGSGEKRAGLVSAFRYGIIETGKSRVVMDLAGPARIAAAEIVRAPSGDAVELRVRLVATDEASFAAAASTPVEQPPSPPEQAVADRRKGRPVVVVDPGHGGIDPGARSPGAVYEKAVTLAVARQLKQILGAAGRYDVHMTRNGDEFVSLDRRLRISRDLDADLFISIHADSIEATQFVHSVRGATIYTLSDKASDDAARMLADKENSVDTLAGIASVAAEDKNEVRSILIDLLKRETSNLSHAFSSILVERLRTGVTLSKEPQRSAAFKVLRQTNSPSVLVELGYMTNEQDEKLLASAEWQRQVAAKVAGAVDAYFGRRTAGPP